MRKGRKKIRSAKAVYLAKHIDAQRGRFEKEQRVITIARRARGWSQDTLAKMIYVSVATLSHYENGISPAPWDDLEKVMPELKEMREKGCMEYCPYPQPCVPTKKCIYRKVGRRAAWQ